MSTTRRFDTFPGHGMDGAPLTFTFDPALDLALTQGWAAWIETARKKGVERTAEWLMRRGELALDLADLEHVLEILLQSPSLFDRAMAASELAELTELDDDEVAATFWEGVMRAGEEAEDSEVYFEGLSRLAEIELEYGAPRAAADLFIGFLNWVRVPEHTTDAESILFAFDQIIELAEVDGALPAAARFTQAQSRFFQAIGGDDSQVVSGNWEANGEPYVVWDV